MIYDLKEARRVSQDQIYAAAELREWLAGALDYIESLQEDLETQRTETKRLREAICTISMKLVDMITP